MFTFIQTHKYRIAIGLTLVTLAFIPFLVSSQSEIQSPQQKAAAELPTVLQEIEDTQTAYDRHLAAQHRKIDLLMCISGSCSSLPLAPGTTPAQ